MNKIIVFFVLFATFITGCKWEKSSHSEEAESEHEHEEITLKLTSYTKNFELFAVADGFVAGQESHVVSHFSHLSDFSPLDSAEVTIRLITGNNQIEEILSNPTSKGIYSFNLKPEQTGKGELIFEIKAGDLRDTLKVEGITVFSTEEEADEAAEKAEPAKTNTAVFTKEQTWKIEYASSLPVRQLFGKVIKTTGKVLSSQGDESVISAKTSGIVNYSVSNLTEGMHVSDGQVLFSISGSGFADNNSAVKFTEARSNFEKAELNYERVKDLAADKIVSDKELQNARFDYENAKAVYENLNRNFDAKGQNLTSPMNGFIKKLYDYPLLYLN